MVVVRKAADRGKYSINWLNSKHTFSFGHYYDPNYMGFGPLRVINEDRVIPGAGFPTHGHDNMEIISYVIDGALEHKDSEGNESTIRPGEVQRMSAGTGIQHSEYNASNDNPVHFLQIWILPEERGLTPGYQQIAFPDSERTNQLRLVGSRDGRLGSVTIHQDVDMFGSTLTAGNSASHALQAGRGAWVQVVKGALTVNGEMLETGDGAAVVDTASVDLTASDDSEIVLFDLPIKPAA